MRSNRSRIYSEVTSLVMEPEKTLPSVAQRPIIGAFSDTLSTIAQRRLVVHPDERVCKIRAYRLITLIRSLAWRVIRVLPLKLRVVGGLMDVIVGRQEVRL